MSTVTVNQSQRLFVLPHQGGGYSCLGFEVVFKRLKQYAEFLGLAQPDQAEIGSLEQYDKYRKAESAFIATNPQKTIFDPETPEVVCEILERYRRNGNPIRLFYGDPTTGKVWLEEHDVYGEVGRSMGPIRVPLLVAKGKAGGGAILTASVVRILDGTTMQELYRHPQYNEPTLTVVQGAPGNKYPVEVYADSQVHARFKSEKKAQSWVRFMRGLQAKP